MFKKYTFTAEKEGKHILVLGAVHGNEVAGTIAQNDIIKSIENGEIKLASGKITFIPVVNVEAQNKDTRFIDVNLNRVVCWHENPQNNEERIANQLIKEIGSCDAMLDLHSTHCKEDEAFAFIDYPSKDNMDFLSLIPVKKALAGWPDIYQGQTINDFCTERYANQKGKMGITVECGYHKSEEAIEVARKSILNVFRYFGIIDENDYQKYNPEVVTLCSFVIKKADGRLSSNYKHMSEVKKGEVIGIYDNGEKEISPMDGFIIMPNHDAIIGSEWFYLGRI